MIAVVFIVIESSEWHRQARCCGIWTIFDIWKIKS